MSQILPIHIWSVKYILAQIRFRVVTVTDSYIENDNFYQPPQQQIPRLLRPGLRGTRKERLARAPGTPNIAQSFTPDNLQSDTSAIEFRDGADQSPAD